MFQNPEKRQLLLPKYPVVLYHCSYYAVLALEAEEWCIQGRNNIWKNLLMKLHLQQGKANIDDALKVCNVHTINYNNYFNIFFPLESMLRIKITSFYIWTFIYLSMDAI